MTAPIWIPCEGSNCPTHFASRSVGMCAMCGEWIPVDGETTKPHDRKDLLAMLDRGDFG